MHLLHDDNEDGNDNSVSLRTELAAQWPVTEGHMQRNGNTQSKQRRKTRKCTSLKIIAIP
jgi:hypothetical protein